uniref:IlGF domain-containing protein n=1 Tax=Panagrellus redivivus TaxID=6233 RepID=A0A7E4ZWJ9_PANRE
MARLSRVVIVLGCLVVFGKAYMTTSSSKDGNGDKLNDLMSHQRHPSHQHRRNRVVRSEPPDSASQDVTISCGLALNKRISKLCGANGRKRNFEAVRTVKRHISVIDRCCKHGGCKDSDLRVYCGDRPT